MIYQNIMLGIDPYSVFINRNTEYPVHIHYELEIVYCLKGQIVADVEGKRHVINTNEAICFNSMVRHGFEYNSSNAEQMVIEFGPAFIGEKFQLLSEAPFDAKIFQSTLENKEIIECLGSIAKAKQSDKPTAPLTVKSKLFELFVLVVEESTRASQSKATGCTSEQNEGKSKIDNALNLVRHKYAESITVEDAARICGYGTSVFCNTFKKVTGTSFHSYLNFYRVETSKYLLSGTKKSVEEIADNVGFSDSKSFCRAFKQKIGISPGQYRKNHTKQSKRS